MAPYGLALFHRRMTLSIADASSVSRSGAVGRKDGERMAGNLNGTRYAEMRSSGPWYGPALRANCIAGCRAIGNPHVHAGWHSLDAQIQNRFPELLKPGLGAPTPPTVRAWARNDPDYPERMLTKGVVSPGELTPLAKSQIDWSKVPAAMRQDSTAEQPKAGTVSVSARANSNGDLTDLFKFIAGVVVTAMITRRLASRTRVQRDPHDAEVRMAPPRRSWPFNRARHRLST